MSCELKISLCSLSFLDVRVGSILDRGNFATVFLARFRKTYPVAVRVSCMEDNIKNEIETMKAVKGVKCLLFYYFNCSELIMIIDCKLQGRERSTTVYVLF